MLLWSASLPAKCFRWFSKEHICSQRQSHIPGSVEDSGVVRVCNRVTTHNCCQELSLGVVTPTLWIRDLFVLREAGELRGWCSKPESRWWGFISDASIHISYAKSIKLNRVSLTFRVSFLVSSTSCSVCTVGFYSLSNVLIVVLVYIIAALSCSFLPLCYPSLLPAQSFLQLIFSVHFTVQSGLQLAGKNVGFSWTSFLILFTLNMQRKKMLLNI